MATITATLIAPSPELNVLPYIALPPAVYTEPEKLLTWPYCVLLEG